MESRYLAERRAKMLKGKPTSKDEKAAKQEKGDWYKAQIAKAPPRCENCGDSLRPTMAINEAAIIAHIVLKSKVPSVAFVELNRLFLCGSCHDKWDRASEKELVKMHVFPIAYERLKTFIHLIPSAELRYVPDVMF